MVAQCCCWRCGSGRVWDNVTAGCIEEGIAVLVIGDGTLTEVSRAASAGELRAELPESQ